MDDDADFLSDPVQVLAYFRKLFIMCRKIHHHHHVEITARDRLGNVQYIAIVLSKIHTDFCNNADRILADYRNNDFFHALYSYLNPHAARQ